jgi:hypothetical protein
MRSATDGSQTGLLSSGSRTRTLLVVTLAIVLPAVWFLVLSPQATARRAVIDVVTTYLAAEAKADCPTVTRLSAQADPCADLDQRAFSLTMMEQTGVWHTQVEGAQARAWTTLATNLHVEYELAQSEDRWLVVAGGVP